MAIVAQQHQIESILNIHAQTCRVTLAALKDALGGDWDMMSVRAANIAVIEKAADILASRLESAEGILGKLKNIAEEARNTLVTP